jgi:ribonucleoside-diphosphate reductase alpha chain
VDYIFRWLASKFLTHEEQIQTGVHVSEKVKVSKPETPAAPNAGAAAPNDFKSMYALDDAPSCAGCGSLMVRNGSCYKCMNCGETSGCS